MTDKTADALRRKKASTYEHPKHNFSLERESRAYSVIGIYCDNGQPCFFHVFSRGVAEAIVDARVIAGHDFDVAGVLSGYHYALDVNDEART